LESASKIYQEPFEKSHAAQHDRKIVPLCIKPVLGTNVLWCFVPFSCVISGTFCFQLDATRIACL